MDDPRAFGAALREAVVKAATDAATAAVEKALAPLAERAVALARDEVIKADLADRRRAAEFEGVTNASLSGLLASWAKLDERVTAISKIAEAADLARLEAMYSEHRAAERRALEGRTEVLKAADTATAAAERAQLAASAAMSIMPELETVIATLGARLEQLAKDAFASERAENEA